MKRSEFLRNVIGLLAAPTIINELAKKPIAHVIKYNAVFFKIPTVAIQDKEYLEYFLTKSYSPWRKRAKECGVDMDKPFETQIGYNGDDFTRNMLTIKLTQCKNNSIN
jgi:hypothetical protein